jgi:hypothetical protein
MKRTLFISFTLSFILTLNSCNKVTEYNIQNFESSKSKNNGKPDDNTPTANWCTCDCWTLAQDDSGEYSCPAGSDCSKTHQPCPCDCGTPVISIGKDISVNTKIALQNAINEFEGAFMANQIKQYFNSQKWRLLFLDLIDKPIILNKLQNGELKFIRKDNNITNKKYYIAVGNNIDESSFNLIDAEYTIEISNEN